MVISQKKSFEDVLKFLENSEKIIIIGCSECATVCKVGGEAEVEEMKEMLEKEGKKVLGTTILNPACNLLNSRKDMKQLKEELKETDAILSLACGDGTQTVAKLVKPEVYPGADTMFIGEIERIGQFEEACKACGECEIGWTATICPITKCAKGLINGPCGGAKDGKCEVSNDNDCAWLLIYDKLKDLGKLENMMSMRESKNFEKGNAPRRINLRNQEKEIAKA